MNEIAAGMERRVWVRLRLRKLRVARARPLPKTQNGPLTEIISLILEEWLGNSFF